MSLNNLANALSTRFGQQGNMGDLDQAITYHQLALGLLPIGHPHHSMSLNNLANALSTRFGQQGDIGDLDQAISYHQQALDLHPVGHPNHSASLNNLAGALARRFGQQGNIGDLDQAITYLRQVLDLCPVGHPNHSTSLNNLAGALSRWFEQQGNIRDLDQAITYHQQALGLHPVGHPNHTASLNNLATALSTRFEQQGNIGDLDQAITYYQQALDLCPIHHPDHSMSLTNLAGALMRLFEQHGNIGDLDQAITYHQQALDLCPIGHPDHSTSLTNLAGALSTRFEQLGNIEDLDQAITYNKEALGLCPLGHSDHALSLNNLAGTLMRLFEQQGNVGDLDQAITYYQKALDMCPVGHLNHSMSLHNLAVALSTQFEQQGNIEDLDQAITYHQKALDLRPIGHPNHSDSLNSLAGALRTRFKQQGNIGDLDQAIHLCEQVDVMPLHHPYQLDLSRTLATLYLLHPEAEKLADKSFSLFHQAAHHISAGSKEQLLASLEWVQLAKKHSHTSELLAYTTALRLVQQYITLHPNIQTQLSALSMVPQSLSPDAAACAIKANQLSTAMELLEEGRAILWRRVGGYRSTLGELMGAGHQVLAMNFQRLGNLLEHSALSPSEGADRSGVSMAKEAQRYHQITQDWDQVIKQIQQIEGFSHFLKPTPFHILQLSASHGPVIAVNISQYHADAIIICSNHDPILVPLPSATLEAIRLLTSHLQSSLASDSPRKRAAGVISVLRSLWDWIAQPVVDHLTWLPQGSQIWWCPTSALCSLPLHAAGKWRKDQPNLSDMFLSSYTPTLSALLRAQAGDPIGAPRPSLLAIGVSELADRSGKLGNVRGELVQIREIGTSKGQHVNFLEDGHATRHTVLNALQQHSWVHLSCHGQQDFNQPFNSCFLLHDTPLTLHDIIQANIPNAELAFLSACHTASGNQRRPDEVIHLAAALQFSGFKTVIGTLWAMDDRDGPDVAKAFYGYMFRNGVENLDHRDAAEALKCVVNALRRKGVPIDRWANFIHIGA